MLCIPLVVVVAVFSYSVMSGSFVTTWTPRLLCPWDFPGKNIRVSCHFLLQGIEPASPALAGGFFTTKVFVDFNLSVTTGQILLFYLFIYFS